MRNSCPRFNAALIIGMVAFFALSASAQVEGSGVIKTRDGVLLVSNEPGNFYTMEIKGSEIKPIQDHFFWFTVDGKFLQIVNAEKSQFLSESEKNLDEKGVLSAHMKWESDYISETLKSKLAVNSSWITLTSGKTAIAWDFDMPQVADKQTAKRQLYILTVNGTHVIGMNTVVEKDGEEAHLRQFLLDRLNSLKPRDKVLPLAEASRQIRGSIPY